jgi:colanic acid/amylovoran biosynthesis glycosyltransferase
MSKSDLRVLAYHRVMAGNSEPPPAPTLVSASPAEFERQVQYIARRYRAVSLDDVVAAQRGQRPLPRRAVLLTFDDAYRDFGDVAWPVLRHYGIPATLCVATDYPGQPTRTFWWDRLHHALRTTGQAELYVPSIGTMPLATPRDRSRAQRLLQDHVKTLPHTRVSDVIDRIVANLGPCYEPSSEVHSWAELRQLASEGVSVVAHTRSHAALTQVDAAQLAYEIAGSLTDVREQIGSAAPVVCYPFGLHNEAAIREAARSGVDLAFTCIDGHNQLPAARPLQLRRTVVTRRTTGLVFGMRLTRAVTYYDALRHAKRSRGGDRRGCEVPAVRDSAPRVAYIMSRFPKLSETFVLNEMAAAEALGADVAVYPLLRERPTVQHAEADAWTRRAHHYRVFSPLNVTAIMWFLCRRPAVLLSVLVEVLRGTAGSLKFRAGAAVMFPKAVRFAFEMQRAGIQHVHAHFATHPALVGFVVHRLTGIPFSFTAHGSDLHVDRCMLAEKVRAAAFAVAVSQYNRDVMIRECGPGAAGKIHVVHCGVDLSTFAPSRPGPPSGHFTIVCVASLVQVKGHRFLVDACHILRQRGVAFGCEVIGDGPLRKSLERLIADRQLEAHVILMGGLPRDQVAARLSVADAAVLASHPTADGRKEGIPVALMEAMASGLPCVATAISGIPELVEDEVSGLLVPSGNAVRLADALERLAGDPVLRQKLGAAARKKIEEEFELRSNTARLLALVNSHQPGGGYAERHARHG